MPTDPDDVFFYFLTPIDMESILWQFFSLILIISAFKFQNKDKYNSRVIL